MGELHNDILGARLIFIFVGTNNIGNGRSDIILRDMQRLVDVLMSIDPNLRIVLSGILPRPCDFLKTHEVLMQINRLR